MRFFSVIFLFFAMLGIVSCSNTQQKTKLRIVDLQGRPHNVRMRTPELNMQALAAQGNLTEEKIQAQPPKSENTPEPQMANNKYANNKDFGASSAEAIKNTLQMPTDPQRPSGAAQQGVEVSEADILTAGDGAKNKNQIIEYNLAQNKIKAAASPSDDAIMPKQKGIFVQTGSFTILQHAKTSLAKIEKFSNDTVTAKIEEAKNNDKTVYRVLIGPFSSKQKASAMVIKLKKSGHQAIIVKNK